MHMHTVCSQYSLLELLTVVTGMLVLRLDSSWLY